MRAAIVSILLLVVSSSCSLPRPRTVSRAQEEEEDEYEGDRYQGLRLISEGLKEIGAGLNRAAGVPLDDE